MREEASTHGAGVFFTALAATSAAQYQLPPAFYVIRELTGPACERSGALRRLELRVCALKHRKARVAARYAQHPAPGVTDHARGLEHHLLHHRLDATAQS